MTEFSLLDELTAADNADYFLARDVSDTTDSLDGTDKRITKQVLLRPVIATVEGVAHTLSETDADLTRLTNAGVITLTLPETATEAVTVGETRFYDLAGDGSIVIVGEAGVVIQSENDYVNITTKWRTVGIMCVAAETFKITGAEVAP